MTHDHEHTMIDVADDRGSAVALVAYQLIAAAVQYSVGTCSSK
jgi:hypothetical protein